MDKSTGPITVRGVTLTRHQWARICGYSYNGLCLRIVAARAAARDAPLDRRETDEHAAATAVIAGEGTPL